MTTRMARSAAAILELLLAASGLALSGFMVAHEAMLSSLWGGAAAMDRLAGCLEGTGLVRPGVLVIAILLVAHALLALRHAPLRLAEARAWIRTAGTLRHWDTVSWGLQLVTAIAVGVLAGLHVWMAGTTLPIEAATSAARVHRLARTGLYDCLLFAVAVHMSLGLERSATKWGWPGRGTARAIAWLLFAGMLVAGFATLVAFHRLARGG